MAFKPTKDPATGMITMVQVPDRGTVPPGLEWTTLLGIALPTDEEIGVSIDPETLEEICSIVAVSTLAGYDASDEIDEQIEMLVETETATNLTEGLARALTTRIADVARARHAEMASAWEGRTDHERLSDAFAALEASGIVARHDLGMSVSDGADEIDDVVDGERAGGRTVRGSVFYHRQDTERAVAGGGLYLVYTGGTPGNEPARLVGGEIREALVAQGLAVDWDGRPSSRLRVDLTWRRRPAAAE